MYQFLFFEIRLNINTHQVDVYYCEFYTLPKINVMPKSKVTCSQCSLQDICLPVNLSNKETERLNSIISRVSPLNKGDILFRKGDKLKSIYAVVSGSFKTFIDDIQKQYMVGFHLPGELMGLDAISDQTYQSSAQALETSTYCELPFEQLTELTMTIPKLQNRFFSLLSQEIRTSTGKQQLITKVTAPETLAYFLIDISNRYKQRGFSPYEFYLTLSRADIGNYLGLAEETISRIFSIFQQKGIIKITRRHVKIIDFEALQEESLSFRVNR